MCQRRRNHKKEELPTEDQTQDLMFNRSAQRLVGDSEAFCSWDAANQSIDESTDHWPFLFSHPVVSAISKKPAA